MKKTMIWMLAGILLLVCGFLYARAADEAPAEEEPAEPAMEAEAMQPAADEGIGADWKGTGAARVFATIEEFEKETGSKISQFNEAPMLMEMVAKGEIPALEQRLPDEPLVVAPADMIGSYGGTLRDNHTGSIDLLQDLLREFPFMYSTDMKDIWPNVLKAWDASDDGTTYVLYLRKGIKWSDGKPFTADDFVFYYQDITMNAELYPSGVRDLKAGGEMGVFEKVDDYSVKVSFIVPNGIFIERLARWRPLPYAPKHYMSGFHPNYVPKNELDAKLKDEGFGAWVELFQDKWEWENNPDAPTIYAWKTLNKHSETVQQLTRNPYYWKVDIAGNQLPYIDGVDRYNLGENREGILLKAMAGELDYGDPVNFGFAENYSVLKKSESAGNYTLVPMVSQNTSARGAIFFNLSHPDPEFKKIFNNRDFRLALALAQNNAEINNIVFNGAYKLVHGSSPPAGPPYHGERDMFKIGMNFDPDEANKMLDEIGLKWDAKHEYRLTASGKPLRFVLTMRDRGETYGAMAEMTKKYWQDVGIGITVRPMGGSLWGEIVYGGKHDIAMDQWGFGGNPPLIAGTRDLAPRDDEWKAAPAWGNWLVTDGKEGEEPPAALKRAFELQTKFTAEPDRAKRIAYEKEMFEIHPTTFWWFSCITQPEDLPQAWYYYFHNSLGNVTIPTPREYYYAIPSSWSKVE